MAGINRWSAPRYQDAVETNIQVDAGNFGQTVLVLSSDHGSIGDATQSCIYMVRLGYNEEHITPVKIAESPEGSSLTFSSMNGNLAIS